MTKDLRSQLEEMAKSILAEAQSGALTDKVDAFKAVANFYTSAYRAEGGKKKKGAETFGAMKEGLMVNGSEAKQ